MVRMNDSLVLSPKTDIYTSLSENQSALWEEHTIRKTEQCEMLCSSHDMTITNSLRAAVVTCQRLGLPTVNHGWERSPWIPVLPDELFGIDIF